MTKKVYVKTFGCQMNEYDSDKMVDVLGAANGLTQTFTPEDADVILFNTCSVREKAQEKVFSDLGRVRELKEAKPNLIIGVGGCVASQEGAAIVSRAPYVDLVFGPQTLHRLPEMIAKRRSSGRAQVDISFPEIEKFDHLPPARVDGPSAFVSIMEGCSKYCSYCVVPSRAPVNSALLLLRRFHLEPRLQLVFQRLLELIVRHPGEHGERVEGGGFPGEFLHVGLQ